MSGGKLRVCMRDPKGYYGEGMVFLEFSTRGPRRAKLKLFPSPGRAIIVRNGEIIPMSREFTPETERQRLQLLVSGKKLPLLCFVEPCACLNPMSQGLPHPHSTDSSLLGGALG